MQVYGTVHILAAPPQNLVRSWTLNPIILLLRAIAGGALRAVSFCHERGVAHGSLGGASFLLSHCDDRRPEQLLVKLDNFGYARRL